MSTGDPTGSGSKPPKGSASRFARDTPRSVQQIVRVAREILAPTLPGERGHFRRVEGGMAGLQAAALHDADRTTRRQVRLAEEFGLMRCSGATRSRQVYVQADVVDIVATAFRANLSGDVVCVFCGAIGSKGEWCSRCQPAFRKDRVWRQTALNLLHEGKSLPTIAAVVGHPLYPSQGDGPLVGVVAHLLCEAPELVPASFREGLFTTVGAEVPKLSSVLTSRGRQRRRRREALNERHQEG